MKKVSVGTWAYIFGPYASHPVSFDTCLEKIKALGFDGLELGAWPPHPTPQEYDTPEKRAALKKKIADAGLGISGLAIDFHGQYPFQDDQAAYLAEFDKNLRIVWRNLQGLLILFDCPGKVSLRLVHVSDLHR